MYKALVLPVFLIVLFSGCIASNTITIPEEICNMTGNSNVVVMYYNNSESEEIYDKMVSLENTQNKQFTFVDMTKDTGIEKFDALKFLANGKPAVLIGCKLYIGLQPTDTYRKAISELK